MKLSYYNDEKNFGDQLNLYIWHKLIPHIFDKEDDTVFVGIGTLINQKCIKKISKFKNKIIFSTGVGYGKVPDQSQLDQSYKIYCLRGPLSAQKLGLSNQLAITDGAVLLRRLINFNNPSKKYKFSYMPHHKLAGDGWKNVCQKLGFGYIDPSYSTDKVIDFILNTEILISEAMHGAIVADALRIPWIPVVSHKNILPFKWEDWCKSIDIDYKPTLINRMHNPSIKSDLLSPLRDARHYVREYKSMKELKLISQNIKPVLSNDNLIEDLTQRLEEKLDQLKTDWNY